MNTYKIFNGYSFVKFIILFWIFIFSTHIHSQKTNDLLQKFTNTKNDSIRIKTLLQLSDEFSLINLDSTLFYLQKAVLIEKKHPNSLLNYKLQNRIGIVYSRKKESDSASYYFKHAITIAKKANLKEGEASTLFNLGTLYLNQRKFENALYQFYKAQNYFEELNKHKKVSQILNNIGITLQSQDRFQEALDYHKTNLLYKKKHNLTSKNAIIYSNMSTNFLSLEKIDSSLFYAKLASISFKKNKDNYGLALVENKIGMVYQKQKKYKLSYKSYLNAIKLSKDVDINLTIEPLVDLANFLQNELEDNKNAKKYYLEAQKLANKIKDKYNLDRIYYGLGKLYKKDGEYKLAANYLSKRIELHDSIYTIERDQKVTDIIAKHEIKEKQQQINLLNEENNTKRQKLKIRNLMITSLFLVLISLLFFFYLLKQKSKQKLEKIENELQKYILQLNDLKNRPKINSKEFIDKYELTEREIEILDLLSKGMSYSVIGETIFISKNTVKYHLKNIYIKLDVKNRIEALNKIKP